ncbi:MAG: MBL fold metallo-hydrolase [Hyphomicrobiales bacterium]|nr:MBL fold metallo-hydrolase [Hyphomicrobiales bacterium]
MRLTVVGCGDAFGSGGRFNTCFWLATARSTLLVDCGASSLVAIKSRGLDHGEIDGIVLTHLHGDHFGALPFLLLDAQLVMRRERPLTIAGPPGSKARIEAAIEIFFPRALTNQWRFRLEIVEIEVGRPTDFLGHTMVTAQVVHQSGAPSTALRISDGETLFAYSGDTEWTEALIGIAEGADLFVVECYGYAGVLSGHLSWEVLKTKLPQLRAKRIMLTHMNASMLARIGEPEAAGLLLAEDGMVLDI